MNLPKLEKIKGFTLIELLIVIGIIAILAAAVIITITPAARLASAREATRRSHMVTVGTAFHITVVEESSYSSIEAILDTVGCGAGVVTVDRAFSDACAVIIGLSAAPVDPSTSTSYLVKATATGSTGRLTITAPSGVPAGEELTLTF